MELLTSLLEFDPKKRSSSIGALCHPVFSTKMSRSPLITKKFVNSEQLIKITHLVEKRAYQQKLGARRQKRDRLV